MSNASYIPSTFETDDTATLPQASVSLHHSATNSPRPADDIYDVEHIDGDCPRQQKVKATEVSAFHPFLAQPFTDWNGTAYCVKFWAGPRN